MIRKCARGKLYVCFLFLADGCRDPPVRADEIKELRELGKVFFF